MRTGRDMLVDNDDESKKFVQNAVSFGAVFFERASRNAATFVQHQQRTIVTKEDLRRALCHQYFDMANVELASLQRMKEEMFGSPEQEEEEDEEEEDLAEEDAEPEPIGKRCNCSLCRDMEEAVFRFANVQPSTVMQKLFFNAIKNTH